MKRFACLLLLLAWLPLCAAAETDSALPPYQQVTQTMVRERPTNDLYVDRSYPQTVNETINGEMRAVIDALTERARPGLPARAQYPQEGAFLNVGATVTRTGESWMSFLSVADILDGREQLYVDFDARAYDVATGARLTLDDLLAEEAGWQLVQQAAQEQLAAYYPQEEADGEALAALTTREALAETPFTLDTAYLRLHYRADALYAGRQTLMHVRIPYGALRAYMTPAALAQTDNGRYPLVAFTFDDGPVRVSTLKLLRNLRNGCMGATFFIVGERIRLGHDVLCLAQDAGFSIASHNYEHIYGGQNRGRVAAFRDQLNEELGSVTGAQARVMRAPGGIEQIFIDEQVGLPLIHWSVVSNSEQIMVQNPWEEARRLAYTVQDGDIVLLHDLFSGTDEIFETLPQLLAERSFLCVTVEELFAARGIELLPDTVYYSARPE